jgi:hypothetical protein
MKNKFTIVILIVVFNQACVEKPKRIPTGSIDIRKELGFAETSIPKKSQLKKSYFQDFNFCYGSLELFENSTFWKSSVCEGKLYFSIGSWIIKHDSIILSYTPVNKLNLIKSYSIKGDTSKFLVLKVTNQDNEPIEDFLIRGYMKGVSIKISPKHASLETDKQGEIKLIKANFDSLEFNGFIDITQKKFTIKAKLLPDTINLALFYNRRNFFRYPVYQFGTNDTLFVIKEQKLIAREYIMTELQIK